jgi:hypothetical protein
MRTRRRRPASRPGVVVWREEHRISKIEIATAKYDVEKYDVEYLPFLNLSTRNGSQTLWLLLLRHRHAC